jgi:RNA polymerase sigma-70 factor (ECF subfamily)
MRDTVHAEQGSEAGPDQDDLVLLRQIAAHDHQAFERLYQRYTPRLTAYLRTLLGSSELVEEVLHDVLLVVWHQAAHYQAAGQVSTWLFGIARYKALEVHTQTTRRPHTLPRIPDAGDQTDPEDSLTCQERARLVRQALAMLPPLLREVLVLTHEHGYSAQMIATRLDCSVATVCYRLQQARRRMAATLIAWEVAPAPRGTAALPVPPRGRASGQPAALPCDVDHTF